MPIFEILCNDCKHEGEVIVLGSEQDLKCPECGSTNTERIMSPTSSLTGKNGPTIPGPGDTGCCGSTPGHSGCAGPGSCCGRNFD
ncbi:MAG: zinc ribbon domain-containing protein [Pseudodesulfovibrio sp.]|nr:zinc ribbon domain-containing protein [Pseudodesulfovibrio sp.]